MGKFLEPDRCKTMRILITGGAGFIGSHLIDRLMNAGHEVVCLDNFYTGHKRNILKWMDHPYFELIRHDITEPIRLEVDQIYHLACPASPVHYQYNPVKTIKTNVLGTMNMLGLAKRVKARFLLSSTSEVYGDPEIHPQTEDYRGNVNPIGIRSCYDEGKRVAETLAFDYHRQNDVEIRVARIFNTYGPRMLENDGRVVSNFVVQALRNQPLTVYGSGSQTRSFCYVSDLVDGLIRLMNGDHIGPVNLGNPDEYTILELAQAVQQMVNPGADIKFEPLPQDDPRRRKPDITRAKTWLGWQPTVALTEGLQMTIEDFRSRMGDGAQPSAPQDEHLSSPQPVS
jgi:UDP-glucuronate decarboxylase